MKDNLHIALLQYDIQWHNIKANLEKIDELLDGIDTPPDLVLLPEMFATGFTMQPELFSKDDFETIRNWMATASKKYQAAILGSNPERDNAKFYNRLQYFTPGGIHQLYDKKHLFTMGDETEHYVAGNELIIAEYKNWNILPLICYDLRFPVWSRNVAYKYDLLVYVANWPSVRNNVWEALLKARAIENQCYTIGVNRIGKDSRGIEYIGNSQIISPRGEIMGKLENEEGILYSELDSEILQRYRSSFPIANDADDFIIK
jgi:predicted amidohydrolase